MNPSAPRWREIAPSQFTWEQEALSFLREGLPDVDPIQVWSNFEFIAEDGSIYEVDALVLTAKGLFLVEIKSWPGNTEATPGPWTSHLDGQIKARDNPYLLANRKAKKLASLLRRQRGLDRLPLPFIQPLIFLSHEQAKAHIDASLREVVFLRDRAPQPGDRGRPGILSALTQIAPAAYSDARRSPVDRPIMRGIVRAMQDAGIRPSLAAGRVGDYVLGDPLFDGPGYQDWIAQHSSIKTARRRIRIYGVARAAGAEERKTIERAARREFMLLQDIHHDGILRVLDFHEHETGPALLFEHDPDAVRLDHFLAERGTQLSVDQRLDLLRQMAEAIRYAHEKRLVHRALSPQSVLVAQPASPRPRAMIFNWQTAARDLGSALASSSGRTFTEHVGQLVEDAAMPYMAPEVWTDPKANGETLDIFGLGAIAYHLFTGQPPAASLSELREKLRASDGLDVAGALDGATQALRDLILDCTRPEVSLRLIESVTDFLKQLTSVEEELTRPEPSADFVSDPTEANAGDRIEGGFVVKRRLGKGSCAVALLVERDGSSEAVLKLSLGPDHDDRLRDEGEVIAQLRHARIVGLLDTVQVGERTGILLEKAGDETLAQRLRKDGRLAVDLLSRFGEDLLDAVRFLEEQGISHRDIKPDNLGITEVGRDRLLHLVLYDFSLSRAPADRVRAGTVPYLEPFLAARGRWDLYAERFAAAVTLYEMATGTLPRWGDGLSDPAVIDDEAAIESDLFDSGVREELTEFFRTALRRGPRERFDTGEEMLRAWRHVFEDIGERRVPTDHGVEAPSAASIANLLNEVVPETPISLLPLSTRARNALERANVLTARDLLQIQNNHISHMRGVGNKTRRELWELRVALGGRLPAIEPGPAARPTTDEEEGGAEPIVKSIDMLVAKLLPARASARATTEPRAMRALLGLEGTHAPGEWPSQTDVAARLGVTRARVGQLVADARKRWLKNSSLTPVRDEIAALLRGEGGVVTAAELAAALLAARGSTHGEPLRSRESAAVARATTEAEQGRSEPRWVMRRAGSLVLLALDAEGLDGDALADWAEGLGRRADKLAETDPLPGPQRVIEELSTIAPPAGAISVPAQRLVRLAAAASQRAAVSNLLELYPRGMDAGRALRLAQGALLGAAELEPQHLQARIAARYPAAAPLPPRPALDALLEQEGFGWLWSPEAGAYRAPSTGIGTASFGPSSLTRVTTVSAPPLDPGPEIAAARAFEEKLQRAERAGSWLVLIVNSVLLERAERELVRRFSVDQRSLEELLLRTMKDEAVRLGADWSVVLRADAAAAASPDGQTLRRLVGNVMPRVERELASSSKTLLLTRPGLLARYDQMQLFERLRDRVGRPAAPGEGMLFGAWLLAPSTEQAAAPMIDGRPIPVVTPGEWARIPEAWLANRHRGARSEAEEA